MALHPSSRSNAIRVLRCLFALLLVCALGACASLPENKYSDYSFSIPQDVQIVKRALEKHDSFGCGIKCSAHAILDSGEEAMEWRLAMADMARETIDAQYYIWKGDEAGTLLLQRLLRAADRGVRVRLLVDDFLIRSSDKNIALLNMHPNFEARIFNPFAHRWRFWANFELIFNLSRLNHRMHNKMFVADNILAISGGRNIGNEYFGLDEKFNFRDMDIISFGPVATELSDSFDLFWNSDWAYPPESFLARQLDEQDLKKHRDRILQWVTEEHKLTQEIDIEQDEWKHMLEDLPNHVIWGPARVISDEPEFKDEENRTQVIKELVNEFDQAQEEIFLITPYFVPLRGGMDKFKETIDRGVKIKVLTNSLGANNHTITHAGYKRYRKELLEMGVELYEFRADSALRKKFSTDPILSKWLGLHAKVIIFDHKDMYVGTMNFDPRSAILNTEIGLLIDSPELALEMESTFAEDLLPENACRVYLDEKGKMRWESSAGIAKRSPARSIWQRMTDWILPAGLVEGQL